MGVARFWGYQAELVHYLQNLASPRLELEQDAEALPEAPVVRGLGLERQQSCTESVSNTEETWKDRDSPRRTILCGETRVMSSPKRSTWPALGVRNPERRLKSVVFPAALGPMMRAFRPPG
jgi:hypothetical protein